ncbi:MAG: DUF4230 domain-containing protein [Erythrobacter sp.]
MDNNLSQQPAPTPQHLASTSRVGWLGARGEMILAAFTLTFLAATLILGWLMFFAKQEGDPVASAAGTFERRNDLIVMTYRVQVDSEAFIPGPAGISMLERRQVMIIPAQIDYRIELSKITKSSMNWDKDNKVFTIELPPLRISTPNLDEKNARVFTNGVWVSRGDAEELARKNSQFAERKAIKYAKDTEILGIARASAREAVRENLSATLRTTGYADARIEVKFKGES